MYGITIYNTISINDGGVAHVDVQKPFFFVYERSSAKLFCKL
jgi:hypothetical protein